MSRLRDDTNCGRMIDPRWRLAALPVPETVEDRPCRLCRIWPLYTITKSGERVPVSCEDCANKGQVATGRNYVAERLLREAVGFVTRPEGVVGGVCSCGFPRLDSFKFCPGCGKPWKQEGKEK